MGKRNQWLEKNIIKTCCQTQATKEISRNFQRLLLDTFLATFAHKFIDLAPQDSPASPQHPQGCTFAFILMQFSRAIRQRSRRHHRRDICLIPFFTIAPCLCNRTAATNNRMPSSLVFVGHAELFGLLSGFIFGGVLTGLKSLWLLLLRKLSRVHTSYF